MAPDRLSASCPLWGSQWLPGVPKGLCFNENVHSSPGRGRAAHCGLQGSAGPWRGCWVLYPGSGLPCREPQPTCPPKSQEAVEAAESGGRPCPPTLAPLCLQAPSSDPAVPSLGLPTPTARFRFEHRGTPPTLTSAPQAPGGLGEPWVHSHLLRHQPCLPVRPWCPVALLMHSVKGLSRILRNLHIFLPGQPIQAGGGAQWRKLLQGRVWV